MKRKQRERAERCLKYFGDVFEIRNVTGMDKKVREIEKRAKQMEKRKANESKQIEKDVLRIMRQAKKKADRSHQPKH